MQKSYLCRAAKAAKLTEKGCTGAYRFGFNGKEKDTDGEWGGLTHYDYGFRIYNPAIEKFLSVDSLTKGYPMLTPYQFASNTPIQAKDLDGLEAKVVIKDVYAQGAARLGDGSYHIIYKTVTKELYPGDQNFDKYANQKVFGDRGTLSVTTLHDIVKVDDTNSADPSAFPDDVLIYSGSAFDELTVVDFSIGKFEVWLNKREGKVEVGGGIMFFSKNGQGQEHRFSKNADIGPNIDMILEAFAGSYGQSKRVSTLTLKMAKSLKAGNWSDLSQVVEAAAYVQNGIDRGLKAAKLGGLIQGKNVKSPVDSVCNSCENKPHGLDYRRIDDEGQVIDTVKVNE